MQEWLGGTQPISVLDFSGVPSTAADLAVGVVLSLLFEVSLRSEPGGPGVGRPSPVLVVLEEAHRYLGDGASALTRDSANRIAREGRKYGIGLLLVTQRPTELPKTALAQCGTLISLRLSNAEDQGAIRAALPDCPAWPVWRQFCLRCVPAKRLLAARPLSCQRVCFLIDQTRCRSLKTPHWLLGGASRICQMSDRLWLRGVELMRLKND